MFDIGFLELILIFVIVLLVFGPERMPELIKKISLYIAKFKRFTSKIQDDINRELKLEELKREIELDKLQTDIREAKNKLQDDLEFLNSEVNFDHKNSVKSSSKEDE